MNNKKYLVIKIFFLLGPERMKEESTFIKLTDDSLGDFFVCFLHNMMISLETVVEKCCLMFSQSNE